MENIDVYKKNKLNLRMSVVLFFIIGLIMCLASLYICNIVYPKKYSEYVEYASKKFDLDENIIYSIIKQESKFKQYATSYKNAKGLMQLLPATADEMAVGLETISKEEYNIYDAYTNILLGSKYLSQLMKKYDGNIYLAIAAYNAGMGNVDKWISSSNKSNFNNYITVLNIIEYGQTRTYLSNVLSNYSWYNKIY